MDSLKVFIVTLIIVITSYTHASENEGQNLSEDTIRIIKTTVRETNEKLPVMVNNFIRFDQVITNQGLVQYKYTVTNVSVSDMNHDQLATMRAELWPRFESSICEDPRYKELLDKQVTVSHSYSDKNGKPYFKVQVTKQRCTTLNQESAAQ